MTRHAEQDEQAFALHGDLDGESLVLPLLPGSNQLGSDPSCDLWLKTAGVSKRHATVRVDGGLVSVEDSASKNGTFVNQRRIDHAAIEPGDKIVFGGATMVLEQIDPDEARIAVDLGLPPRKNVGAPTTETRNASAAFRGVGSSILEIAISFVEALGPRDAADPFSEALSQITREIKLQGLCLFSATDCAGVDGGELAFTASAGDIGAVDVPAIKAALARPMRGETLELSLPAAVGETESEADCGPRLLLADASRRCGLVAWGARTDLSEVRALLRLVLATVNHVAVPGRTIGREAGRVSELVFPESYIVGESAAMVDFFRRLQPVVHSDLPVLVLGETGTGKESVAQILHASSDRARRPLVTLNCAAIPHDLIEAELFGIGGGVATGVSARVGKFQEANGGTLFLDEIGDLPLSLQAKLLRALQDGDVRPLGRKPESVDVRIVAATNCDLERQMEAGLFRGDLYYRLAGLVVQVPPLRARSGDLPALVAHFLRREAEKAEKSVRGLTVGAMKKLAARQWPGNVRELEHEARRLVHMAKANQLIGSAMVTAAAIRRSAAEAVDLTELECLELGEIEKLVLVEALRRADGQVTEAARLLGITRQALRRRMGRHGL